MTEPAEASRSDEWSDWTDEPSTAATTDYGPGHVGVWCDVDGRNVSTPAEFEAWAKDWLWTFMPYGGRGQIWLIGDRLEDGKPRSWALEVALDRPGSGDMVADVFLSCW